MDKPNTISLSLDGGNKTLTHSLSPSPPAKSPRPSVPASEYDSEFDFSDAEAQDRTAGVVHDAVQQAVMQYGYDGELFPRRGGTARYGERTCRRRWWLWLWTFARGGERSKRGVGASTRRSGSPATPAPLVAAAVAAAPTLFAALLCRVVPRVFILSS